MFQKEDLAAIAFKGLTPEEVNNQLVRFQKGYPFLEIDQTAQVNHGIIQLNEQEKSALCAAWNAYLEKGHLVSKFVPASGAASRMFKDLFEWLNQKEHTLESAFIQQFFNGLKQFAFYDELQKACLTNEKMDIDHLMQSGLHHLVVENLLTAKGLNYGSLPKGLLTFHAYPNGNRKAVIEHLVEGALYASSQGVVNIHFTVSPEHKKAFEQTIKSALPDMERMFKVTYLISFSEQKQSTDTIAADKDNQPFRENGALVFRPGGHGALIENLNDLDSDVVFIKNIDNIVPDRLKDNTVLYKKVLAGLLVTRQKQVFDYLELLESGQYDHDQLLEIIHFLQSDLYTRNPETKLLEDADLALYLMQKLHRPIRVCGMVRNTGEPGGGPFWAKNPDGTFSLQILESSQIDLNDPMKKEMFKNSTHFNPVDLVCSLKDHRNQKFDLKQFTDPNTGFISIKSKNGEALKALELPGLWNGAMSNWNTIFVEIPMETFNPVKTVNDLLRPEHQ
jgi:hypothetical protein